VLRPGFSLKKFEKRFEPGSAAFPARSREAAILDRTILPEHKSRESLSSSKSFRSYTEPVLARTRTVVVRLNPVFRPIEL
jgi:hypothetical protein